MRKVFSILLVCSMCVPIATFSKKKKDVVKQETAYEKFFKGKNCRTAKGMISVHMINDKLYFELPSSIFGKEMLMGSTITEISDNYHSLVGQKPRDPILVKFEKHGDNVMLSQMTPKRFAADNEANIQSSLSKSSLGASLDLFKVEVYSPDSSSMVVDMTDFFIDIEDRKYFDPFDPYSIYVLMDMDRTTKYCKERSKVSGAKAFDDNFSVLTTLSYDVDVKRRGYYYRQKQPFTTVVTHSFLLLPEVPMKMHYADYRIGTFYSVKEMYNTKKVVSDYCFLSDKFNLQPKDVEAYKRGELCEPVKPITFYIDKDFPESWKPSLKYAVEDWNGAFERIGFKNAVKAEYFPVDDPEFDPDNLKYSCIRYAPLGIENAMGPSWTDPRSGEIINASVYVYHDVIKLLRDWRFVQTSAADPDVRSVELPDSIFKDAIRYVIRHEVGHCLGFMHNMAASAAFPTDSLRSPSFTQKYGTTASIMDYARFNYIAQPGDKERGVAMTPPMLGPYDYYLVDYLYRVYPDQTPEQEQAIRRAMITEKLKDPIYRYGKQQISYRLDPSAFEEDLGDDAVKSAEYGLNNLKFVMANMNDWVAGNDYDFSFRRDSYINIINQYLLYLNRVIYNLGGVYLNECYPEDVLESYVMIDKQTQQKSLRFLLGELDGMEWLDDPAFVKNIPMMGNITYDIKRSIFHGLLSRVKMVKVSAEKNESDPYTPQEYLDEIYKYVWNPTLSGNRLSDKDMYVQTAFVESLIESSNVAEYGIKRGRSIAASPYAIATPEYVNKSKNLFERNYIENMRMSRTPEQTSGFGFAAISWYDSMESIDPYYYDMLKRCKKIIDQKKSTGNVVEKQHYDLLSYKITQSLER